MNDSPVSGSNRAKTRFMPGVTSEHRGRASVSREALIEHMLDVVKRLGRFPFKAEYEKLEGAKHGTTVYVALGHKGLAAACGYQLVKIHAPNHPNRYRHVYMKIGEHVTQYQKKIKMLPHECLNGLSCMGVPVNRVSQRFEYCEPCKKDRGWYD
jgi:hypothetical protein